jgi:hypothetical protein
MGVDRARDAARATLALFLLVAGATGGGAGWWDDARVVPREAIVAAMRESRGYSLTATANGPRLQAEVLRRLVREAQGQDPERRPLHIQHRDWFLAFLERTGLGAEQAPLYARLSDQMEQDLWIDYRRERVVDAIVAGGEPRIAANVRVAWPDRPGRPNSYSYDDLLASPHLRVTQKRVIAYRLLEYADRVWYAEVSGLYGRPTSGALGVLFNVIGEARVRDSRSAFAADGTQVVRGRATKWFIDKTATATVWPDGHADRGVPPDREDLERLDERLREPLEVRFQPLPPD